MRTFFVWMVCYSFIKIRSRREPQYLRAVRIPICFIYVGDVFSFASLRFPVLASLTKQLCFWNTKLYSSILYSFAGRWCCNRFTCWTNIVSIEFAWRFDLKLKNRFAHLRNGRKEFKLLNFQKKQTNVRWYTQLHKHTRKDGNKTKLCKIIQQSESDWKFQHWYKPKRN